MNLKQSLSVALILSQASLGWAGQVDTTAEPTPEVNLLTSIVALSGEKLPQAQIQEQVADDIRAYNATAPIAGRAARTEQALVSLEIYTPDQAQAFERQLQTTTSTLSSAHFASTEDAKTAIGQQLSMLPQPGGAEFSGGSCLEGLGIEVLAAAAMVGGIDLDQGPNTGLDLLAVLVGVGGGAFLLVNTVMGFGCFGDEY